MVPKFGALVGTDRICATGSGALISTGYMHHEAPVETVGNATVLLYYALMCLKINLSARFSL